MVLVEMPNSWAASFGCNKRLFFIHQVYQLCPTLSNFLESRSSRAHRHASMIESLSFMSEGGVVMLCQSAGLPGMVPRPANGHAGAGESACPRSARSRRHESVRPE